MRLTDYTDYSLRALIYVASHPDEPVTIQHIADAYGIPRNHLIKIVQKLGQEGFLRTTRGRAGGLRLGREPKDINIGEVVRTTESDFAMVECFHDDNRCVITRACVLKNVLQRALQAWFEVLDGVTLQDLVDKPAALNRAFSQALSLVDVRDELHEAATVAAAAKRGKPPRPARAPRQTGT
ncbi:MULTISPECIES: Rrf2 family transcriptional regulator [unclassified Achromobacter]|uniref:RrF2 family transcriptional regulator n=1 Tax=unclassified Achromobacter TaxID=2626865 RepID=UPI000B51781C|nr:MULTISPECIES: Rrf2 family transcriptional regulator [unclassified Achromobacter]OWT68181.1 Rrf2 family transcriptional regulator [Achromobacter sp. HZ34]OWT70018.1 Rrf2 family transcriptional regulator [Achromobacter sp. HZ28]